MPGWLKKSKPYGAPEHTDMRHLTCGELFSLTYSPLFMAVSKSKPQLMASASKKESYNDAQDIRLS